MKNCSKVYEKSYIDEDMTKIDVSDCVGIC